MRGTHGKLVPKKVFLAAGIGGETLNKTLQAVRPFGLVASVGQVAVGGKEDTAVLPLRELGPYRSIGLTRPGVFRFMTDPVRYREGGQATLARLAAGMAVDVSVTLLRLDSPLLGVGLSQESFRLGWIALNTDLSLVAHFAVLVFAFTDGSHVVFCVRSAKCDGTKTGWREMALLCSAAKLCRLL